VIWIPVITILLWIVLAVQGALCAVGGLRSTHSVWTYVLIYSGLILYLSNSSCHCWLFIGGLYPSNDHSVIDSPDFVSRVSPPIVTIPATSAAVERRWIEMDRAWGLVVCGSGIVEKGRDGRDGRGIFDLNDDAKYF
jgi:hypothetical protein